MNVLHLANLEITVRHSRKARRLGPVHALGQVVHHLEPVHVIVRAQELVENEQLSDGVGQVEQLDEHVDGDQVVAVALAPHEAAVLGDLLTDADKAAGPVLPGALYPPVHVAHDVLDGALPLVRGHVGPSRRPA